MKYQFIQQQSVHFTISLLCRVLEVSRSGYYAWVQRPLSRRAQQDQALAEQIQLIHQQSRHTYGSPRVHAQLQAQGVCCAEKRVARLMQAQRLSARVRRRFKATTDSGHHWPVADNQLGQQFAVAEIER